MLASEDAGDEAPLNPDLQEAIAGLSERQLACLVHTGDGLSSKEIGRLLGISPSTVDNHIHVAVAKLHARNRWEAAKLLHPVPRQSGSESSARERLIPPLGGSPNVYNGRKRLMQILALAVISIVALSSFVILVMGAKYVFDLR